MFAEFMGILGEAINGTIEQYNALDKEREEILESIKRYNAKATLCGKKPIAIVETNNTSSNEELSKLKKYFSEKTYSSQYKAESDLNGFEFRRVSGSTWKRGNTIASIEFVANRYAYIIKLF